MLSFVLPEWVGTLAVGAAGAIVASWAAAYLALQRAKKERAFDKRVKWHENAIERIAEYQECMERLGRQVRNELIIQGTAAETPASKPQLPTTVRVPSALWEELRQIEAAARAALRLADLFTRGPLPVRCSVALSTTINVVSSQWVDLSSEPLVPWQALAGKSSQADGLRRELQESLAEVLEFEGFWYRTLGKRYRRLVQQRRLRKAALALQVSEGAS